MGEPLKIYEGESAVVAPLATFAPGTYQFPVELRGNALISTVWVDAINGATITATWKDYNPLTADLYTVFTHPPIATDGYHREFIAQATHGVAVLEIVVAGGSPRFGAFATANILTGSYASPDSTQNVTGNLTFSQGANLSTGKTKKVVVITANTEQSYTFPAGTKLFFLKARTTGKLLLAFDVNGTTAGDYVTVFPGGFYKSPEFDKPSYTIYFQSPVAGLELELESWS